MSTPARLTAQQIIKNQVLNKIKIAVRTSSQKGLYKYDESMINAWGNDGIINSVLKNNAAYINKLSIK